MNNIGLGVVKRHQSAVRFRQIKQLINQSKKVLTVSAYQTALGVVSADVFSRTHDDGQRRAKFVGDIGIKRVFDSFTSANSRLVFKRNW